jgi:hypothetical protein
MIDSLLISLRQHRRMGHGFRFEKTNDYENFEKGMIYMKIVKKGGVVEKRGEEETKSMPHAPVE